MHFTALVLGTACSILAFFPPPGLAAGASHSLRGRQLQPRGFSKIFPWRKKQAEAEVVLEDHRIVLHPQTHEPRYNVAFERRTKEGLHEAVLVYLHRDVSEPITLDPTDLGLVDAMRWSLIHGTSIPYKGICAILVAYREVEGLARRPTELRYYTTAFNQPGVPQIPGCQYTQHGGRTTSRFWSKNDPELPAPAAVK